MHVRTLKELDYQEHTDTILFGSSLGSVATEHGALSIAAGGGTVRFTLEGIDGYVDLDLQNFASAALAWLGARKTEKISEISDAMALCPSCEKPRPRPWTPGSVCPHCGHVEPEPSDD